MNRIRDKLILAFLAATIIPLAATLWITDSLLERSLSYAATEELDTLSKSLEKTGREFYQASEKILKEDARAGRITPERFTVDEKTKWPAVVQEFWNSSDPERFDLADAAGDRLNYLERRDTEVLRYTKTLDGVQMETLSDQYRRARELVEAAKSRDLRRGFSVTLMILVAVVWLLSLLSLIFLASRISRPIRQLTAGLSELASGNLSVRIEPKRTDETGRAIEAFNRTAVELQESRDRLVYLTQVASWQMLARKMAHELKNSLTPIRLTVEEILARQNEPDSRFMEQAVQIVVAEIETLERRVRAFSEFSSEPAPQPAMLDIPNTIEERVAFLKPAHAGIVYRVRLPEREIQVFADHDQVKGILTNLLENAAEAASPAGEVRIAVRTADERIFVEIDDSGPGLSAEALRTLFEPTITFKKYGMGLGLSIARKNALRNGGDLVTMKSELGGAAFCLILPRAL